GEGGDVEIERGGGVGGERGDDAGDQRVAVGGADGRLEAVGRRVGAADGDQHLDPGGVGGGDERVRLAVEPGVGSHGAVGVRAQGKVGDVRQRGEVDPFQRQLRLV